MFNKCPICKTWFMKKSWQWYKNKNREEIILIYSLICRNKKCAFQYLPHKQEIKINKVLNRSN